MSKFEIMQKVANAHNMISRIAVSGENTVTMAGAILELRNLTRALQEDINAEQDGQAGEGEASANRAEDGSA